MYIILYYIILYYIYPMPEQCGRPQALTARAAPGPDGLGGTRPNVPDILMGMSARTEALGRCKGEWGQGRPQLRP